MINRVYGEVYQVEEKIGQGAFAEVYRVLNRTDSRRYAAKFEDVKSNHQELYVEHKILQRIHKDEGVVGIPHIFYYGVSDNRNMLVSELLGESLDKKMKDNGNKFTLKTVIMVIDQMIKRLELLHSHRIIHRDLKPGNMAVGLGSNSQTIYLLDFGKSKKFMDSNDVHIQMKTNKLAVGNVRYTSLNSDKGIEQSRRDDLETLFYIALYFLKSKLPWQGIKAANICEKFRSIRNAKAKIPPQMLCAGLPPEFEKWITYVRGMKFEQAPDYSFLKGLIKSMMTENKFIMDYMYDWKIKGFIKPAQNPNPVETNPIGKQLSRQLTKPLGGTTSSPMSPPKNPLVPPRPPVTSPPKRV
jgi:casein kinase 1